MKGLSRTSIAWWFVLWCSTVSLSDCYTQELHEKSTCYLKAMEVSKSVFKSQLTYRPLTSIGDAVPKIAPRSLLQLVHKEPATVLYSDRYVPLTAILRPVETDFSSNRGPCSGGVSSTQPTGGLRSTLLPLHASFRHLRGFAARQAIPLL